MTTTPEPHDCRKRGCYILREWRLEAGGQFVEYGPADHIADRRSAIATAKFRARYTQGDGIRIHGPRGGLIHVSG